MEEITEYTDYDTNPTKEERVDAVASQAPSTNDPQSDDSQYDTSSTEASTNKRSASDVKTRPHKAKRRARDIIDPQFTAAQTRIEEQVADDVKLAYIQPSTHTYDDNPTQVDGDIPKTGFGLADTIGTPGNSSQDDSGKRLGAASGFRRHMNARKAFGKKAHLCPTCKSLNLTVDKFVIDQEEPADHAVRGRPDFWDKKVMGTFKEIRERSDCSLCSLLVDSMSALGYSDETAKSKSTLDATCGLYWTVDGMERPSEGHRGQPHTKKRTRRLCIQWSNKPMEKAYIVLVAPEGQSPTRDGEIGVSNKDDWQKPQIFLGRMLTAIEHSNIDLIRRWLDICTNCHTEECKVHDDLSARVEEDLRSPTFTVIDVNDMCLGHLPQNGEEEDSRYVALSYTWGDESRTSGGHAPPRSTSKDRFKTITSNVKDLEEKNGLVPFLLGMPMAIQDAIKLTRKLGYPYLWVDSLCIIQNDRDSWILNAEVMDVVYGNAEFTICAADGEGSEKVGLTALFPPSKYERTATQVTAQYPMETGSPLRLMLSRPSESYIATSKWNTRAWTFQERLLSLRCLIFVNGRMYFQCRTTVMSEDIYSEFPNAGWSVELLDAPAHTLKRLEDDPITVYKNCLKMYTSRQLTHDEDILAAFNGIANIIRSALADQTNEKNRCPLVFGLPPSHFDWALLWEPDETPQRRLLSNGKEFPSWSWCGWKGKEGNKISYREALVSGPEINLHEWLMKHTWITYYIRNGRGQLRLVWDPMRHKPNEDIDTRWRGYKSPETGLPGGSAYSKEEGALDPKFDFHGRPFNQNVPADGRVERIGHQFFRKTPKFRRVINVLRPGKEGRSAYDGPTRDEPLLQFWTWSVDFFLGQENAECEDGSCTKAESRKLKRFAILDRYGDKVGTCLLDPSWSDAAKDLKPQRFIALSDARSLHITERGYWSQYTQDPGAPWQLYNVMMLECPAGGDVDEDIAYRAGLGKVFKSAFPNGINYDWKEIILG